MAELFWQKCKERLATLGYHIEEMNERKGPFAAMIAEITASRAGEEAEKLIYKLPAANRSWEMELVFTLREELQPWLSYIIEVFPDEPAALLMKHTGEPYLLSDPLEPKDTDRRRDALKQVSAILSQLHLRTEQTAKQWGRTGRLRTYPYSREWADWSLQQSERLSATENSPYSRGEVDTLRDIAERFYSNYSDSSLLCPPVLTHGDTHWGNVLIREGVLTLIDWEWACVSTPMRDVAILLQEEPEDDIARAIVEHHIQLLMEGKYGASREALLHDFDAMMIDNALMMLGWEIELYFRGERSAVALKAAMTVLFRRILQHWNQYIDRRGYRV